jgi:ubiquitin carboxyl-terminal hydrolase 9/24
MSITEKELKEMDKESVSRVLKELKDFFTLSMTDIQTAEFIEINQLNMSLRFLRSTYLEKKLKGLQEIKSMISSIEAAQNIAQQRLRLQNNPQYAGRMNMDFDMINLKEKPPKYITAESLKDWILSQKVLEIVFGENTHVEIVKRSSCILKFLAKQGSLPPESVDLLWKCQLGKHEDMVRVVYSTI